MDLNQRAEIQSRLFKLQGEFFALRTLCEDCEALSLFHTLETGRTAVNDALNEITGRDDLPPGQLKFAIQRDGDK